MRRVRHPLGCAAVALLLAGAGVLLVRPVLRASAAFMSVQDPLDSASLVLPLVEDAEAVATLYRAGDADTVVVWTTPKTPLEQLGLVLPKDERLSSRLVALGVPTERIVRLPRPVEDTEDLGRALASYVGGNSGNPGPTRVIVVAEGPWSRLFRGDLRRGLSRAPVEILMHPVPPTRFDPHAWWRSEEGLFTYLDVYVLWTLRLLRL